jgi:hypothetical protein
MWQIPKIWENKRCWIIGGGVSLPKQFGVPDHVIDEVTEGNLSPYTYTSWMEFLKNENVIGVNVAYLFGGLVDVLLFGDPPFYRTHHKEIRNFSGVKVACAQLGSAYKEDQKGIKTVKKDLRKGLSINRTGGLKWNSHAGGAAIDLAASLGASEIYLLGFDMKADEKGRTHWHKEYKHKTSHSAFDLFQESFSHIARDADRAGIRIYNVNPDSAITQFPKTTVKAVSSKNSFGHAVQEIKREKREKKDIRVLVTSANMGLNKSSKMVEQEGVKVDFICYNDKNFPTRDSSFTPRMNAKIPKMLAWELNPGYDYYIWIDSYFDMYKSDAVMWFIENIEGHDALFFRHPFRSSILEEAMHIVEKEKKGNKKIANKIKGEPILQQAEKYRLDPDFPDDFLITANAFCYSSKLVRNRRFNVMKEWFYQTCIGSVRDQISLPYVLNMFDTNYRLIDKNTFRFRYLKRDRHYD